jgi:predicted AlkP superfamily pyrophosphatase or phosphodiesterase
VNNRIAVFIIVGFLLIQCFALAQNVVIVVIDGARYTETCGAGTLYMPHLWKELRPLGTLWTNFRNDSLTITDPAHASIATGTWQLTDNGGFFRPTQPTIFEYFRKATGAPETAVAVIVGKHKLDRISFSSHSEYGKEYSAYVSLGTDNISVAESSKTIFKQNHPRITLINFPSTDGAGHSGNWMQYVSAIHTVDSLIYDIWQTLQADPFYQNNTTLFITNDHGRHDKLHGGFKNHGDGCEGCRHIMLFALGRKIPTYQVITQKRTQCDIAPTVGELLSFPTPFSIGTSLLCDTAAVQR